MDDLEVVFGEVGFEVVGEECEGGGGDVDFVIGGDFVEGTDFDVDDVTAAVLGAVAEGEGHVRGEQAVEGGVCCFAAFEAVGVDVVASAVNVFEVVVEVLAHFGHAHFKFFLFRVHRWVLLNFGFVYW